MPAPLDCGRAPWRVAPPKKRSFGHPWALELRHPWLRTFLGGATRQGLLALSCLNCALKNGTSADPSATCLDGQPQLSLSSVPFPVFQLAVTPKLNRAGGSGLPKLCGARDGAAQASQGRAEGAGFGRPDPPARRNQPKSPVTAGRLVSSLKEKRQPPSFFTRISLNSLGLPWPLEAFISGPMKPPSIFLRFFGSSSFWYWAT